MINYRSLNGSKYAYFIAGGLCIAIELALLVLGAIFYYDYSVITPLPWKRRNASIELCAICQQFMLAFMALYYKRDLSIV